MENNNKVIMYHRDDKDKIMKILDNIELKGLNNMANLLMVAGIINNPLPPENKIDDAE